MSGYPTATNPRVEVDVSVLEAAVKRDGRPIVVIFRDAGLNDAAWWRIRERGYCLLSTIDNLCRVLGLDLWEVEA